MFAFCAVYLLKTGQSTTAGCPSCFRPRKRLVDKRPAFGGPVNWLEEKYHKLRMFDGRRNKDDLFDSMEAWLDADVVTRKEIELQNRIPILDFQVAESRSHAVNI